MTGTPIESTDGPPMKREFYTPPPVRQRVVARHFNGESIRKITREVGIDRQTVTRILSTPDMQEFRAEARSRLFGLVPKAVKALEEVLLSNNLRLKAAIATKLLESLGSIRKDGFDDATLGKEQRDQYHMVVGQLTDMAINKAITYNQDIPPAWITFYEKLKILMERPRSTGTPAISGEDVELCRIPIVPGKGKA